MYDQVGGGFARYSVDAHWLVPHFEKMLYDNALLARAYLHGWQVTGRRRSSGASPRRRWTGLCARCAARRAASTRRSTPTPRARRASSTSGRRRAARALGGELIADDGDAWFGATGRGNFEGKNILTRGQDEPEQLDDWRAAALRGARASASGPGWMTSGLTSWNALMISALADAGAVLERDDYLDAARGAADFVLREMRDADGRLLRTWKDGRAQAERLPGGPRLPGRGAARRSTRPPSSRAGSPRRARWPTR